MLEATKRTWVLEDGDICVGIGCLVMVEGVARGPRLGTLPGDYAVTTERRLLIATRALGAD